MDTTSDPELFTRLVRQHQAMVYSLARHVLANPEDAAECAQEVFCKLFQHLGKLESEAHVLFWLRQVTTRQAYDGWRRLKLRPRLGLDDVAEPSTPAHNADPWKQDRLQQAMRRLPVKYRAVVALRYQEELQPGEIAAILGESVNTIKSRLHRALEALRESPVWDAAAAVDAAGELTS